MSIQDECIRYNDGVIKTKKILPYQEYKINLRIKYLNKTKKNIAF